MRVYGKDCAAPLLGTEGEEHLSSDPLSFQQMSPGYSQLLGEIMTRLVSSGLTYIRLQCQML